MKSSIAEGNYDKNALNARYISVELTPLHPGTIRDLFSPKRNTPVAKKQAHDPLGLPSISSQCIHVGIEELSEGYDYIRCVKDADMSLGRHGWLCAEHGADHFIQTRRQEYRDKDAEIVEGIIACEQRALKGAPREVVRIGAKIRIEYIAQ